MATQQDIYAAGSENHHTMLLKHNYIPCLVFFFVMLKNQMSEDEFTKLEAKQVEANDQEREAQLLNELDKFTSIEGETIESYYHRFSKIMNDLDRNNLTPKPIAFNMKFLNNLHPEWKHYVIIVNQMKKLHDVDYNQLYDYLKQYQEEVNEIQGSRALCQELHTKDKEERFYLLSGAAAFSLKRRSMDSMVVDAKCKEEGKINVNFIFMANLQQALTSSTHADTAPIYDSDGSTEELYTELLKSTTKTYLEQQSDSNIILEASNIDPSGGQV
ncbi:hypothetical protein Tco_1003715 [Tanacetum coccineum]|uniref:Gag-Pol polyprotein n=1 Tax=Tanacetum coccineum TaxID=301880 RepID=A0ABQ5FAC6_9ASTR